MATSSSLASRARGAAADILGGVVLGIGALLLVLVAVGFAFAALYWATVGFLGPGYSCLLLGAVALLLSALLVRSARHLMTSNSPSPSPPKKPGAVIRAYPFESVTCAFFAGVATGVSPESRQTVISGVRFALRQSGYLR